jgi:hypothetical protein
MDPRYSLVATYFHKIHSLWQKLDHYQNLQPVSAADAVKIKKMIGEERAYEFLGKLNSEYDPVRVQIFGKEPLPSLQEVFSYIQNESRRSTMLHPNSQIQFALVGASQHASIGDFRIQDDKHKLFCDHCNRSQHTWGHPPTRSHGGRTGGQIRPLANHTSIVEMVIPTPETYPSATDIVDLSKDKVEALRQLMSDWTHLLLHHFPSLLQVI